jgi:hypothetical protein
MKHFIDQEISVELVDGTFLEKTPKCPRRIFWQDRWINVVRLNSSWHDFSRRGDLSRNLREEHLQRAQRIGSWGVGRFYFEVEGDDGGIYTFYYDRAPANAGDRKGTWILITLEKE